MTRAGRKTVLVTRPRGEAEAFATTLERRGYAAIAAPLLEIVLDESARVDLGGVRAVLFTSANGVRAWARVGAPHESEAFCVGDDLKPWSTVTAIHDLHPTKRRYCTFVLIGPRQMRNPSRESE